MIKSLSQHVVKTPKGEWAVKKGGSFKITKICKTRKEAIIYGKRIAKNQHAKFYLYIIVSLITVTPEQSFCSLPSQLLVLFYLQGRLW